ASSTTRSRSGTPTWTTTGASSPTSPASSATPGPSYTEPVIYCVVPPELEEEMYEKLREYYRDNPQVEVILDRRTGPDRRTAGDAGGHAERRETRDRRRARIPGTFASTDVAEP